MTTKMIPKRNDDMIQTIHPNRADPYTRGADGSFDIDDGDVEEMKRQHGLVEKGAMTK